MYSKGPCHAGTWRQLNITEARKVNKEIMRIYRTMLGHNRPVAERVSDNSIIEQLKILSPLSVVADLRIRLFVRVIVSAPSQLFTYSC